MVLEHGRPAAAARPDGPALAARRPLVLDAAAAGLSTAATRGDARDLRPIGTGRGFLGSAVGRLRQGRGRSGEALTCGKGGRAGRGWYVRHLALIATNVVLSTASAVGPAASSSRASSAARSGSREATRQGTHRRVTQEKRGLRTEARSSPTCRAG